MGFANLFRDISLGVKRSKDWPKVRKQHLLIHPKCECCGGKEKIEVHHKKPVWLFPELELELCNLMTLCEKRGCHLAMGHLYSYKSYNPDIDKDVIVWNEKIANRPKGQ